MQKILEETKRRVIERLYRQNAVKVNLETGFTLKGGTKSPIYVDLGVLENDPAARGDIASAFFVLLATNHNFDAVVGVVSGGISWASSIANSRVLPLIRVHGQPKSYGLYNQIEGGLPMDAVRVLIMDDAITTGNNVLNVVKALREGEGGRSAQVIGICTVFDWDFPAVNQNFFDAGVKKISLTTCQEVLDYGFENNLLPLEAKPMIDAFRKQYC